MNYCDTDFGHGLGVCLSVRTTHKLGTIESIISVHYCAEDRENNQNRITYVQVYNIILLCYTQC